MFSIKKFSVGDLVTQKIKLENFEDVNNPSVEISRCGIIIEVSNATSIIEWSNKQHNDPEKKLVIFNTTLRKMIMDGLVSHFSVENQ